MNDQHNTTNGTAPTLAEKSYWALADESMRELYAPTPKQELPSRIVFRRMIPGCMANNRNDEPAE